MATRKPKFREKSPKKEHSKVHTSATRSDIFNMRHIKMHSSCSGPLMLTRIPKTEVKRGMFVEAVECPVVAFGRRRFVLKSDQELTEILESPADFVLINTALGADGSALTRQMGAEPARPPLSSEQAKSEAAAAVARSTKILKAELIGLVTGDPFDMASIKPVVEEITQADDQTSSFFFEVTRLKHKDETTFQHSLAVSILMGKLGDALDLEVETVEMLIVAGLLHDIGKLMIPTEILQKQGPLTAAERATIQSHPRRGHQILKSHAVIPPEVLEICLHHHEALDGSGYPSRLAGADISQLVRICTVCDVFDALTSIRPYKQGWSAGKALGWMFERNNQFDRKLVLRLGAIIKS
jgi:putative nucleotidyltransferase with HDIG domain